MKATVWPDLESDVLKFQNVIGDRTFLQTRETLLGMSLNKKYLAALQQAKQK